VGIATQFSRSLTKQLLRNTPYRSSARPRQCGPTYWHCYNSYILRGSSLKFIEPLAEAVLVSLYSCQHGTGSVNKQPPQVRIAALAYTQQPGLSAG
jgi:hypothetical protein